MGHTFVAGLYWDRRLERAERRFGRVVEAPGRTRKLLAATRRHEERAEAAVVRGAKVVRSLPPADEPAESAVPVNLAGGAGEKVLRGSPGGPR